MRGRPSNSAPPSWSRKGRGPRRCSTTPWRWPGSPPPPPWRRRARPEREPHPGAYLAFQALSQALAEPDIWPAVFVRFEAGLLEELGFALDLSKGAVTGQADDLVYLSPRTGRAVSRGAGEPYKDRLLPLPPFLLSAQSRLEAGDVAAGLALTAHFLAAFIFNPMDRPLPPARLWLVDRLREAGRL